MVVELDKWRGEGGKGVVERPNDVLLFRICRDDSSNWLARRSRRPVTVVSIKSNLRRAGDRTQRRMASWVMEYTLGRNATGLFMERKRSGSWFDVGEKVGSYSQSHGVALMYQGNH